VSFTQEDKRNKLDDRLQFAKLDSIRIQLDNAHREFDFINRVFDSTKHTIDSTLDKNLQVWALKSYVDRQLLGKTNKYLSQRVDSLGGRLKALEDALIESPSKSLAIPLLKINLDNLKENELKDTQTIRNEINTIYDQNKWFIGLMFTLAIGMLSLAVSNFLPKKESKQTVDKPDDKPQSKP
jgi:hypothetical protein